MSSRRLVAAGVSPAALAALVGGDLENAIIASIPGGIEAQEASEQKRFVRSTTLPKKIAHGNTREQFETVGIKFGEDADDLFVNCELPFGWTKRPTEHSMWSELVDEKGRVRALIFYKGAFYDRNAHMSLSRRFVPGCMPEGGWEQKYDNETCARVAYVKDCGEIVWQSTPVAPSEQMAWYLIDEYLCRVARKWLNENYPDWENPLAYWDEVMT